MEIRDTINAQVFEQVTQLWEKTGVGNPARGDTLEAICATLQCNGKFLTIFNNQTLLGTCWITCDGRRLYVHHMAVSPEHQNQGLGSLLLNEVIKYSSKMKLQTKLEVHAENANALHLYKKFGFTPLEGYLSFIRRNC